MTARLVEKDQIFRGEMLAGFLEGGPLPLDLGPLVLGGAKGFFPGQPPVCVRPD
jgi:hypothetical protein